MGSTKIGYADRLGSFGNRILPGCQGGFLLSAGIKWNKPYIFQPSGKGEQK